MTSALEEIVSGSTANGQDAPYTVKDFKSDQDVRWCPGCGDYAILSQMQKLLPTLNVPKEKIVFVSGIGCSSRFPYYMNTYGFHGIHGRAPAIATGLKIARPDLSVWVITGDGDALSIGGNHLIHICRRNPNINILMFNNEIYGLTKGQYSPTSEQGLVTKSTPFGSLDYPFNPIALALGAGATFVARTMDRDLKHLQSILHRAHDHGGAAFVEIYQNCNVFHDGAFEAYTDKSTRADRTVYLKDGEPLIFGAERDKGIRLDGVTPRVISLRDGEYSIDDALVHDESDPNLAVLLANMMHDPLLPRPMGVFQCIARPTYESEVQEQVDAALHKYGPGDLQALYRSGHTWTITPKSGQ